MNKLCVVTICFNDLKGLQTTISSLQTQTSHHFDQLIIDGGSTDGTVDFLQNLNLPWAMTWTSEKDRGIYDAMNKGLAKANSEFIWFLNSGDSCASESVVEEILKNLTPDNDIVYGKAWYVGEFGKKSVGKPVNASSFNRGMPICHQSTIYRAELAKQHPYPTDYRIISDWIVTQRLFEKTTRTKFLDVYIANFDLSGISAQNHFKVLKEKLRSEKNTLIKAEILTFLGGKFALIWLVKKAGLYKRFKAWQSS